MMLENIHYFICYRDGYDYYGVINRLEYENHISYKIILKKYNNGTLYEIIPNTFDLTVYKSTKFSQTSLQYEHVIKIIRDFDNFLEKYVDTGDTTT